MYFTGIGKGIDMCREVIEYSIDYLKSSNGWIKYVCVLELLTLYCMRKWQVVLFASTSINTNRPYGKQLQK